MARKANKKQNKTLTAKDLREDLADLGVVVNVSEQIWLRLLSMDVDRSCFGLSVKASGTEENGFKYTPANSGRKRPTICEKVGVGSYNKIIIGNTSRIHREVQAEGFAMDLTVPWAKHETLKRARYARQPKKLAELEGFCKNEWAKIPQVRIEPLLAGYKKCLQAVMCTKVGVAKYIPCQVPKLLLQALFLFFGILYLYLHLLPT